MQVRYAASHVQHMQKALEQMNVKLTEVVSDITGLTGMSIIGAILDGERDPVKLAKLRDERCPHTEEEIAVALDGTWRPEHLFELRQAHELYEFHHRQITECDQQVEAELAKFPTGRERRPGRAKPRKRGHKSNDVRFDANGPVVLGVGRGPDPDRGDRSGNGPGDSGGNRRRCQSLSHGEALRELAAAVPPQNQSNKTNKRRGHRKGTSRVTIALRMAARSVGRTMTPLGFFYRRIRSRIGGLGAVKATAHKLACFVYRMLKYGEEYVTQSMEEYEVKMRVNLLKSLQRKAAAMGFQLGPLPTQ